MSAQDASGRAPDIRREERDGRGRYVLEVDGAAVEMTYFRRPDGVIVADHTFTPDALRGRGLARIVVERAVADARADGARIEPACSYVAALFDRNPDWADLRA